MTDAFKDLISIASILGACLSVIATLISLALVRHERRRKITAVEAADFQEILESDDIYALGKYLDNSIGQFDVGEYVSSQDVSSRIDRYMVKLKDYVGTSEQIAEEETIAVPEGTQPLESPAVMLQQFRPPYDKVFRELTTGERWNALARLRRYIEISLREIASSLGHKDPMHLRSAGQILHVLATNDNVDQNAVNQLRYSVSVCNRAVHGREVAENEAMEALWVAQKAMDRLVAQ